MLREKAKLKMFLFHFETIEKIILFGNGYTVDAINGRWDRCWVDLSC